MQWLVFVMRLTVVDPFVVYHTRSPPLRRCAADDGTITPLVNAAEFESARNATDLIVIKFFAPWCRACRGLEPKYKRISVEYSKKGVNFYEITSAESLSFVGLHFFFSDCVAPFKVVIIRRRDVKFF